MGSTAVLCLNNYLELILQSSKAKLFSETKLFIMIFTYVPKVF